MNSKYKFSNYGEDDYHDIIKKKLRLTEEIKKKSPKMKGLVCVDTAPIMESMAQKAGLGWQESNNELN